MIGMPDNAVISRALRYPIVVLIGALLLADHCGADDTPIRFMNPTIHEDDFEEWLTETFEENAPEVTVLRNLYGDYCDEWSDGTAEVRASLDEYNRVYKEWEEAGRVGLPPPSDLSIMMGSLRWARDRIAVENKLDHAVDTILAHGTEARVSWDALSARSRRRAFLPTLGLPHLPLPDLESMLNDLGIDCSLDTMDTLLRDYTTALDQEIVAIQDRYFAKREAIHRVKRETQNAALANEHRAESFRLLLPVYQITITFADAIIAELDGAQQQAFEEAWLGLWIPEIARVTPAELAITRLRASFSEQDSPRHLAALKALDTDYRRQMQSFNRGLIALHPPSRQIRWLAGETTEDYHAELREWYQSVQGEPYAVFVHPQHEIHADRFELVISTCRQLQMLCEDIDIPVDVRLLLSTFTEVPIIKESRK